VALRVFARTADRLAEGPVWDEASGRLRWVDIERGLLHSADASCADLQTIRFPERVGSFALADNGGLIVALERTIAVCDSGGGGLRPIFCNGEPMGTTRFNDGKCDPAGRFWAGTLDLEFRRPLGSLYRCDGERQGRRMVSDVCISNGLAWSPDGSRMYFADSVTRRVDRFVFDGRSGTLGERTPFFDTSRFPGMPDGATVSADGRYWLALYDGQALLVIDECGTLLDRIALPVARPTCCTFGGPDRRTLFITCAADEPGCRSADFDGVSVLALDIDAQGLPAAHFRDATTVPRTQPSPEP
jgi:sugar lactone lactonase YvrE